MNFQNLWRELQAEWDPAQEKWRDYHFTNGNMTYRHVYEGGNWKNYTLAHDAENHLTSVSDDATASFAYDGDGQRITSTEGGITTAFIGNYFEWNESAGTLKKYYYAGSSRIAMRSGSGDAQFLLSDHTVFAGAGLGSTNRILNYDGSSGVQDRGYKPWGEVRFGPDDYPTGYQFTGQYRDKLIGLYYYGARWYDTTLGRFVQPDSIIVNSENPQSWDRYAYVINSHLKYIDPSGHDPWWCGADQNCISDWTKNNSLTIQYRLNELKVEESNLIQELKRDNTIHVIINGQEYTGEELAEYLENCMKNPLNPECNEASGEFSFWFEQSNSKGYSIFYGKMDWTGLALNLIGVGGDIFLFTVPMGDGPGVIIWLISEIAEGADVAISIEEYQNTCTNCGLIPIFTWEFGKLVPVVGFFFNLMELDLIVGKAQQFEIVPINK